MAFDPNVLADNAAQLADAVRRAEQTRQVANDATAAYNQAVADRKAASKKLAAYLNANPDILAP